LTTQLYLYSYI